MKSAGRRLDRYTAWGLTWLAYATYYTGRKGFSVAKKPIEESLGIGRDALATIDTAFLGAYAVGQFLNGLLGDRIGARRLIGLGMLLSAATCAAFGSASGVALFAVLFLINGYAQSTGWPGTTRAMAEWTTPENRGTVMAFWATCYQVGGIVATAGAAWILGRYGWRAVFHVPALLIAAVAVLVLLWLKPGPTSLMGNRSAPSADDVARLRLARRQVLRSPVAWSYGTSYFCIKLIRYSLLFWLPYYLSDGLGYAPEDAGYLSTAFEIGGVFGVISIGVASDRLRRSPRALLAVIALGTLGLFLLAYGELAPAGIATNAAGLALIGAFLFGPDSLISGAAAQDLGGPDAAATATGFVNGMGSLGAILQGFVTVQVSTTFGWRSLFVVFVGLAFIAAVALLPSLRQRVPARLEAAASPEGNAPR